MSRLFRIIFLLCCTISYFIGRAQEPYHTVLHKADGLPSNSVYAIFQDSRGFIWIASDEGLTRYDGYEFKTFKSSSQTSRAGNGIAEDQYGRIWYKNFDGYLYYVEHDTLKALKQNLTTGKAAYGIIGNRLLVKSVQGIDIFDLNTLKIVKNIPFDNINGTGELNYKGHYYSIQNGEVAVISANGDIDHLPLKCEGTPYPSENGIILIYCGVNKTTCTEVQNRSVIDRQISPNIKFVQGAAYEGKIHWLLTAEGMWGYDTEWKEINNGKPYFPTHNISCILKDREGNYWVGTLDEGILFVPDLNTQLISAPGFVPNSFYRINGKTYASTKTNQVFEFSNESGNYIKRFDIGTKHHIYSIASNSSNDRFYIASRDFHITDGHFQPLNSAANGIKAMVNVDHKYAAYVSTGSTGLIKTANSGNSIWDSIFAASPSTQRNGIFCDFVMARGRGKTVTYDPVTNTIYTGSSVGIMKITPHSISEIKNKGLSIYARKLEYYRGILYILTQQNTLYTLRESRLEMWNPENGEEPLLLRKAGNTLYLITSAGMNKLDTISGKFIPLNLRSSLRSHEVNDIEEADGKLMIATDKGALLINKNDTTKSAVLPAFVVHSIFVNGRKFPIADIGSLSYKQSDIDIRYSVLAFTIGNYYRLQYCINGGKWQTTESATRSLKLASLAPGRYHIAFRLVGSNGSTFYQTPITLKIKKPIWQLWWFWGICFVIIATSGYVYYKWQTSLLHKKNALTIEKMELEKNLRNSMLTAIRAQMNPHFFYNALNTIQSFIFSDDKRNASTYLVKMSRLTRLILEMSEKEAITLDEEVEALKLYLELEQIRFGNDFTYEINIAANTDSELVKIPSMIVQPYVENAIKHGLLHKQGLKKLVVDFTRVNGTLCATIDDNGIGRERAAEIKQPMKIKHQPFSTNANSKRIELLNKERDKSIGVVYTDKKDKENNPLGTTVTISIPLV